MYESFYNLSESPFRLTPDPRFYFSSATHKRALTHLRFGFHEREGFVVITGKPGTGKTELMLHLLEGLPKERITYGKIVTSNLDANQTLQQVAAAFHIPAEGVKKGILLKKLEDFFLQQIRDNRRLVLIIDEAHKLSVNSLNELQMLTNYQLSGKVALQCFLSGHDTLKVKLRDPELLHLKQRVITSTFLTPLEKEETRFYVEHRLQCVGWNEDPRFNQTAYSLIHDVTEGIPRQINALCNRILLRAYAEQKHYIDENMVSRAIDDVQSEPLASSPFAALAQADLQTPQRSRVGEPESFQATFERSMQRAPAFEPAHHYNDEDQTLTLPLTSATNFYPTNTAGSAIRNTAHAHAEIGPSNGPVVQAAAGQSVVANVAAHGGEPVAVNQEDTLDDARRFSDALNRFHQKTATSNASNTENSPGNSQPPIQDERRAGSADHYPDTLSRINSGNRNHKPRKSWAAPLAYGSVAFLLISLGLAVWIYNFSSDILGIIEAKNPQDNRFVGSIKGLLMQNPPSAGDKVATASQNDTSNDARDNQTLSGNTAEANANDSNTNENAKPTTDIAVADAVDDDAPQDAPVEMVVAQGQKLSADTKAGGKAVAEGDAGASGEKWDNGALGGKYLKPAESETEQRLQLAANEAANEKVSAVAADEPVKTATPHTTGTAGVTPKKRSQANGQSTKQAIKPRPHKNKPQKGAIVNSKDAKITPPKNKITKNKTLNKINANDAKGGTRGPKPRNRQNAATLHSKSMVKRGTHARALSHPENHLALSSRNEGESPKAEMSDTVADIVSEQDNDVNASSQNSAGEPKTKDYTRDKVAVVGTGKLDPFGESGEAFDKARLNRLVDKLTEAYEKGNLRELLSVLSKDVRTKDGSTKRDLKEGYRKLFNITDMRQMTISSVTWSKKDRFIHGKGEFKLRVREKGADTISSYGGIISMDVDNRENGAVITRLNYDYKN